MFVELVNRSKPAGHLLKSAGRAESRQAATCGVLLRYAVIRLIESLAHPTRANPGVHEDLLTQRKPEAAVHYTRAQSALMRLKS